MRPSSSILLRAALATSLSLTLAACGGDDAASGVDATIGGCTLPSATISCTVGDNTPCAAACSVSYCHNFDRVGVVCTQACTDATNCPAGWSCNGMGRCRPPDP